MAPGSYDQDAGRLLLASGPQRIQRRAGHPPQRIRTGSRDLIACRHSGSTRSVPIPLTSRNSHRALPSMGSWRVDWLVRSGQDRTEWQCVDASPKTLARSKPGNLPGWLRTRASKSPQRRCWHPLTAMEEFLPHIHHLGAAAKGRRCRPRPGPHVAPCSQVRLGHDRPSVRSIRDRRGCRHREDDGEQEHPPLRRRAVSARLADVRTADGRRRACCPGPLSWLGCAADGPQRTGDCLADAWILGSARSAATAVMGVRRPRQPRMSSKTCRSVRSRLSSASSACARSRWVWSAAAVC
jgi:hypothetical protein